MTEQPEAAATSSQCVNNAARLLLAAEMETNLATMEQMTWVAEVWLNVGHLILAIEGQGLDDEP